MVGVLATRAGGLAPVVVCGATTCWATGASAAWAVSDEADALSLLEEDEAAAALFFLWWGRARLESAPAHRATPAANIIHAAFIIGPLPFYPSDYVIG